MIANREKDERSHFVHLLPLFSDVFLGLKKKKLVNRSQRPLQSRLIAGDNIVSTDLGSHPYPDFKASA